jgi:hypothetical protein
MVAEKSLRAKVQAHQVDLVVEQVARVVLAEVSPAAVLERRVRATRAVTTTTAATSMVLVAVALVALEYRATVAALVA